ncbi:MAG TPA: Mut7-C RNAse domain-containing protein [Terriglobia bacterium]|nr:Mut7-C RNAse domain-containing protein [Terriglobia bacterium]
MNASEIRFVADRMLGRLARMLRMLGYDTLYDAAITPGELEAAARQSGRVVLTRGAAHIRLPNISNLFSVKSDNAPEQLREVVRRFELDTHQGLWSRCTLCNGNIETVEKGAVATLVPPKVFEVYEEFYRCAACRHIYWQGSHVTRILKNLEALLGARED